MLQLTMVMLKPMLTMLTMLKTTETMTTATTLAMVVAAAEAAAGRVWGRPAPAPTAAGLPPVEAAKGA